MKRATKCDSGYSYSRLVEEWRERGVRVVAWTVNHPIEKQHFARILKVTYMTDTLTGETSAHSFGI